MTVNSDAAVIHLASPVNGITPRTHYDRGGGPGGWDSFTFVVLLKRLRPATDMMRS